MNYYFLIAAILSLFAVVGHFTMGSKMYLKPVLDSDIEAIPKQVMHSLFHYMSVFMLISTYVLLEASLSWVFVFKETDVVLYTGIIYGGLALAQIIVALSSGIPGSLAKMFQWVFWTLISVLSIVGVFAMD